MFTKHCSTKRADEQSVREREKFPVRWAGGGTLAKRLMAGFAKLVLLLSVGSFGTLAYADLVTLKPTAYPSKICSGQSFDVTFGVESTSIINKMYAWLSFDPALLQGNTATGLVTGGTAMAEFASLGAMVFTAPSSTLNVPAGNTNLFTFNFTPLAVGTTNLTFREDLTWSKRVDVDPDIDMPVDTLLPQVNQGLQLTVENCGGNPPGPNTLTVTKVGTATGTVTSTSAGINCGEDCTEEYPLNTQVTLIASPISTFAGWSGDCTGISTTTTVTMDTAKNCIATFGEVPPNCNANVLYSELNICHLNHIECVFNDLSNCDAIKAECDDNAQRLYGLCYKLNVAKIGNGTVKSTGGLGGTLDCGSTCSDYYAFEDKVTLTATTGVTWTGACSGTASSCVVTIPAAIQTDVTATFSDTPAKVRLDVTKTGNGTITSTPAGISCGTDCIEDYALNTQVTQITLTATADPGFVFTGWSGACSGTSPTVTVTMDAAKNCTATFALAVPKISATPTSQKFESVGIGYPVTKSFAISNIGGTDLNIGKLSMAVSTVFAIQEDTCSNQTIAPAGTCTISVKFSPTETKIKSLSLFIPSSDPVVPTLKLTVLGTGIYMPNLVINTIPDFGNFGNVTVGSASTTHELIISNTGPGNLIVGTATFSTDFTLPSDTCSGKTIVLNGTCTIQVAFTPKSAGAKSSALGIPSNAPGSPHNVPLGGTGLNPTFDLTVIKQGTGKGIVTADDNGINCGDGGTDCSDPYDQNSTVTLTATPATADDYYGTFKTIIWPAELGCPQGSNTCQVTMNASKTVTVEFKLLPNIALGFTTLDLGTAPLQSGLGIAFTIVNSQTIGSSNGVGALRVGANLEITGFTLDNPADFELVARTYPQNTEANACNLSGPTTLVTNTNYLRCWMTIRVKGDTIGVKTGTLTIHSNDPDTPEFKVNLRAEVISMEAKDISDVACSSLTPTIQSNNELGSWDIPSDWSTNTVPGENDVVLIKTGHFMMGKSLPVKVKALCVEKDATLFSVSDSDLTIEATDGISNYGTITGNMDPDDKDIQPCATKLGNSVTLKAGVSVAASTGVSVETEHWEGAGAPIYNVGTIEAGNGGNGVDGSTCAGKGGEVIILGKNVLNDIPVDENGNPIKDSDGNLIVGVIKAGQGGNAISGAGGMGGHTTIWGNIGDGLGYLNNQNQSQINAGSGGKGCPGGEGGWISLISEPNLIPGNVNRATPELGGTGLAGCANGANGYVVLEPSVITFEANKQVRGGNIIIFGGENWTLNLSKANQTLVEATGDITLQVGKNSVIDLSGNQTTVLKAAGKVTLLSDDIRLDDGINLSDIIEATEIVTGPSKIRYAVSVMSPGKMVGKPNTVLPIRVTIGNAGPKLDTYDLSVSDTAGWPISAIEPSIPLEGLDIIDLPLDVTLPDTLGAINVITVTAISQIDPTVTATTEVVIEVTDGKIVMPKLPLGNYIVSGTLKDQTGNSIADATIQIGDHTTTTDATGYWEIANWTNGDYTVTASKDGYTIETKNFTVKSDNVTVNLEAVRMKSGLAVTKAGTGTGTVISSPSGAGISCGKICSYDFPANSKITLTAYNIKGSLFTGWSGDCSGTAAKIVVTLDKAKNCVANFDVKVPPPDGMYSLTVAKTGTGQGTITGSTSSINCGTNCLSNFNSGATYWLTAKPDIASKFIKWSGDCSGTNAAVKVTFTKNLTCTAEFALK